MAQSATLEEQVTSLLSGNRIYTDNQEEWQFLMESYLGGLDYQDGLHLTRYQTETAQEYGRRLQSTPMENHSHSVISLYNSFLFRTSPAREYNSIENAPELEGFLKDCDHDGRSLDAFMRDACTWASVHGQSWILVAKPDIGALTRADEILQDVRPYLTLVTSLAMLDWSWSRSPSGRYYLDYIRYVEDINGDVTYVKEWFTDEIITTAINTDDRVILERVVEENGLGFIPAVCLQNGRGIVRGMGVSDISDISRIQKFQYNAFSEIQQSMILDSHPSLVTTPDVEIGTGAGSILRVPENLDAGLKPYLLEYSGASIDKILASVASLNGSVDRMANTGATRATEVRNMSGVAMEVEFQNLNSKLSEKASYLELAEEQIWRIWCAYQDYPYDVYIEYPNSFAVRDTDREYQQLKMAKDTATNPELLREIDNKLAELMGIELGEEMEHPTTIEGEDRSAHIQEMIMQGYEDAEMLNLHPEINQADIDAAKAELLNV